MISLQLTKWMGGSTATPNEKLAESLDILKALQEKGRRVFRSDDLSRIHRERLVANGFLQEVMKGWLVSTGPRRTARRQHALVCIILGILRALLPRAF
jgi:glutathione S-transferase